MQERLQVLTDKDKELVLKAKSMSSIEWSEVYDMQKEADTQLGKDLLKSISVSLYHKEEGKNI